MMKLSIQHSKRKRFFTTSLSLSCLSSEVPGKSMGFDGSHVCVACSPNYVLSSFWLRYCVAYAVKLGDSPEKKLSDKRFLMNLVWLLLRLSHHRFQSSYLWIFYKMARFVIPNLEGLSIFVSFLHDRGIKFLEALSPSTELRAQGVTWELTNINFSR